MKSFFTKLGTLLLCGVAVAMVGCTDFSEDIQAGDLANSEKIAATDVKVENLQKAIDALSAQLAADYATKQELANVQSTLTNEIQTQVNGLNTKFNQVSNDLETAKTAINGQIAALAQADADNKAALEAAIATAKSEASAAIATLQTALNDQKTTLEAQIAAVQDEIAAAKEELEAVLAEKAGKEYVDEELGKVDAKANELFNTIQSLSEYLGTLQAQVLELKNTLDSLALYLPTVEEKIANNTAMAQELQNTLLSLSQHLSEKEALVDAQLKELQNTLLSLDVYMDSLEASIDARFAEILNTIESLALHLVEVEAQIALNTESAASANAKAEELYNTLLSLSYAYNEDKASNSAKFTEIQNTLLSLSDHLAAEEAANIAKFAEILNTIESLAQHLDEREPIVDAKLAELHMTLQSLSPVIENLDAKILEVKNTVESLGMVTMDSLAVHNAKIYEMNNTLVSLSLFLEEANLIVRVAALEDDLKAHLAAYEEFQAATVEDLANLFARTNEIFGQLEALSPDFAAVKAQVAELQKTLLSLSEHLGEREANVDAKLNELRDTFLSLEPVIATMQAQILENNSALVSLSPVIETLKAQILENFNTLQSLSPKIEELEEKDAQLEAMVREVKNELLALSEYLPTMQAQILENKGTLDSLSEYLPEMKAEVEAKISAVDAKANELNGQLTALAEQLPAMFAEVNASIAAVAEDVKNLLNRLQSIVFVPEYDDHRATINFVKLKVGNETLNVSAKSVLKYKVNAEDAEKTALALALNADKLSFEVKTVKTRTADLAQPELEIVGVNAKDGYLNVYVQFKNFSDDFFGRRASGDKSYSVALLVADGNNNVATEFTNLVANYVGQIYPVILDAEGKEYAKEPAETHMISYEPGDDSVVILADNKLAFRDAQTNAVVAADVLANYDLNIERTLKFGDAEFAETDVKVTNIDNAFRVLYSVDYDAEESDFVVTLGGNFNKNDKGTQYDFNVNYSVNGLDLYETSRIELTNKLISYNVPAVVVPWSMGLSDSLRVVTNESSVLYRLPIERNAAYEVPENFEGYTLGAIVQTGTTKVREVTVNGVPTTDVDIQAYFNEDDEYVTLSLINQTEKGYAFPAYDAEEDYNEYKITWVKEHESVTATVTATILLGKQPAPVAVDCGHKVLSLNGSDVFYSAEVDFRTLAYNAFDAELQKTGVKNLGYATADDAKAAFNAAFAATSKSVSEVNTVKVGGQDGTEWNVAYNTGLVRFYGNDKAYETATDNGVQLYTLYETAVNDFWFNVPFSFELNATLDVPSYGLLFSTADYVTVVDENNGRVEVDGDIVGNVYTIDQADLAKYFNVSNDADNTNGLTVEFVVKTTGAPAPNVSVVAVHEDPNPDVEYQVLTYEQAVIEDWTHGNTFKQNEIEVEAVLVANGTFELDRKTVVLYTVDPLNLTSENHVEPRVPGKDITVKTFQYLTLTSTEEEGNLINVDGLTSKGLFHYSKADVTYGAHYKVALKRVYTTDENGDHAYPTHKYKYDNGIITLKAEDGILLNSVYAEVEYKLTHNFNLEQQDEEAEVNTEVEVVKVEFKPVAQN